MADPRPGDLCVIIPTRQRWDILQRTLAALRRQTVEGFEVVVVVDGEDQTPPALDARVLVKPRGGPGAARNHAARTTERPLILLLGDDMIPQPQTVERHLSSHAAHPEPEVAVLGHVEWHPEVRRSRLNRWMDWSDTQFDYSKLRRMGGQDVGFGRFFSCNVSLKRGFFLDAGGFDEDFTFYYEDLDCGWRLSRRGMRLLYQPDAVVDHLHAYDWQRVRRRFQGVAEGERLMAAKHEWFDPHFLLRVRSARARGRVLPIWPLIVDPVEDALGDRRPGLRARLRDRANIVYYRRLAKPYEQAWEAAGRRLEAAG